MLIIVDSPFFQYNTDTDTPQTFQKARQKDRTFQYIEDKALVILWWVVALNCPLAIPLTATLWYRPPCDARQFFTEHTLLYLWQTRSRTLLWYTTLKLVTIPYQTSPHSAMPYHTIMCICVSVDIPQYDGIRVTADLRDTVSVCLVTMVDDGDTKTVKTNKMSCFYKDQS